jgi:hypothetical protein
MQLMTQEVLEVLDELETPRREVELLNFLYSSNYYANNDTGFKDNSYLCIKDKLYQQYNILYIIEYNYLIIN